MRSYWPSYTGTDEKFWEHEYNKHGYCYTVKSKTTGFQPFFKVGLDLYKNLNLAQIIDEVVSRSSGTEIQISSDELRNSINKRYSNLFYDFACERSGSKQYIKEIRIYLNLDLKSFNPPKHDIECSRTQPITIGKFN